MSPPPLSLRVVVVVVVVPFSPYDPFLPFTIDEIWDESGGYISNQFPACLLCMHSPAQFEGEGLSDEGGGHFLR
jgi:hypothetical protein